MYNNHQKEIDDAIKNKKLYFIGERLPADWYEAFSTWLPIAESGNVKAQFNVARCFTRGDGVEENKELALFWFKKAASENEPRSHYNLYLIYKDSGNNEESGKWLSKAVELDEPRALQEVKENIFYERRLNAISLLKNDQLIEAKKLIKLNISEGDTDSFLIEKFCNISINYNQIFFTHTYNYDIPIVGLSNGGVGGGGTGSGSYRNPGVKFTVKNNNNSVCSIILYVGEYSSIDTNKKIGGDRARYSPSLQPGESWEEQIEMFSSDESKSLYLIGSKLIDSTNGQEIRIDFDSKKFLVSKIGDIEKEQKKVEKQLKFLLLLLKLFLVGKIIFSIKNIFV